MITLSSNELSTVCAGFQKIIPRKSGIPTLSYVRVHAGGLVATNLEESLEFSHPGPTTPFLIRFDDLKRLNTGLSKAATVTLTLADGHIEATIEDAQRMTQSLETLPVDEFPTQTTDGDFSDLDIGAFLRGFQQAARAASHDPTRLALNGVHLDPDGPCLVATDGHRLMKLSSDISPPRPVTVPRTKLLGSSVLRGEGRIAVTDSQLLIQTGPWRYSCTLIDAMFPDYRSVIPSREGCIEIDLGDYEPKAVLRAIGKLPETGRSLYFYASTARVAILADDVGSGYVAIDLPGVAELDDPLTISFDRRYFADAVRSGFRKLAITDRFKPASFYDDDACYILMPLRESPGNAITRWMQHSYSEPTPAPEVMMPVAASPPEPDLAALPDPLDELLHAITAAQRTLKDATTGLRDVKRGLKSFVRDARREQRDNAGKLKEIQAARAAIARLQAVVDA